MRDSSFFVRSTDLTLARAALINGRSAATLYNSLIEIIERRVGTEAASLFAEPVFPTNGAGSNLIISWYSAHEGAVVELDALDEAAWRPAASRLKQRLQSLSPLLSDSQIGAALSSWLNLTSPNDILLIGGEPVLINWGFYPAEVAATPDLRRQHFLRTLGRFAEGLPTPPLEAVLPPGQEPLSKASDSGKLAAEKMQSMQDNDPHRGGQGASRPWLAPLVASAIALLVLLVLLIPGVLRYPDASAGLAANTLEEERLRASNDSLEQQLKALEAQTGSLTCRPADLTIPVPGFDNPSGQQPPRMEAIPRPPEKVSLPAEPSASNDIGKLLDSTTVLIVVAKFPQYSQGSGFFISDRHIVTNHHVIRGAEEGNIFVVGRGIGGVRRARLLAKTSPEPTEQDINPDVAILEIEPVAGQQGLKLGVAPAKLSTAYVAGFPGFLTEKDRDFTNFMKQLASAAAGHDLESLLAHPSFNPPSADLRYGRINNSIRSGSRKLSILIHDMQLAPGNSGGPLVDSCGRLGGINTALFTNESGAQQGNVAQDVSIVRDFLQHKNIAFHSEDSACNTAAASNEPSDRR